MYKRQDEAFATWTVIEKTDDDEFRKPTKMKQIKKSVLLIDQVIGMCPSDADVIERLNSLTDVINSCLLYTSNDKQLLMNSGADVYVIVDLQKDISAASGSRVSLIMTCLLYTSRCV